MARYVAIARYCSPATFASRERLGWPTKMCDERSEFGLTPTLLCSRLKQVRRIKAESMDSSARMPKSQTKYD
jgi:hypothetical protein